MAMYTDGHFVEELTTIKLKHYIYCLIVMAKRKYEIAVVDDKTGYVQHHVKMYRNKLKRYFENSPS